jgi:cold shock CspA family protein
MSDQQRFTGTIVHDSFTARGFGFVRPDGEPTRDIFLHRSTLLGGGLDGLAVGARISFEVGMDPRNGRPRAQNVKLA